MRRRGRLSWWRLQTRFIGFGVGWSRRMRIAGYGRVGKSLWCGRLVLGRATRTGSGRCRRARGVEGQGRRPRPVPAGWDQVRRERPDMDVLTAAGFQPVRSARFLTDHEWTVEELIGFVYSTSALPTAVLRTRTGVESELRSELGRYAIANKLRRDDRLRLRVSSPTDIATPVRHARQGRTHRTGPRLIAKAGLGANRWSAPVSDT